MHILYTVLHTVLMVLLGRICSNIKKFYLPLVITLFILMTCMFNQAVLQSFRFWDEDDYEYEIFLLLSSALAWANAILVGTSYQILEV